MKTKTLRLFSDPGHGWIRVKKELLTKLGIEKDISACSYQRNKYAYLEEDCDASVLIVALKIRGYEVLFKSSFTNKQSKIRNYSQYTYTI